jgi:hypothetical protein
MNYPRLQRLLKQAKEVGCEAELRDGRVPAQVEPEAVVPGASAGIAVSTFLGPGSGAFELARHVHRN